MGKLNQRKYLLAGIVLLAILVRLAAVVWFRTYQIPPQRNHWEFGYETGRIADSLATGHGYSSPMPEPSGPTGFIAPGFPLLLAGIFKIFGPYTTASAVAIYAFDTLLSALTCLPLYRLGARIFGHTVGLAAAALFAVYPPSIWHAGGSVWDVTLLTFAVVVLMDCLYALPPLSGRARLAVLGLFMGAIVLINPAPAACYPFLVVWLAYRLWRNSHAPWYAFQGAAILTFACCAVFLPWMIRNEVVMGEFTPRTASGVTLRLGNNEGAWKAKNGGFSAEIYPSNFEPEDKIFHQLGETGYDLYCRRIALDFIRQNPRKFADLIGYRIYAWWLGPAGGAWKNNWNTSFGLAGLKQMMALLPSLGLPLYFLVWRRRRPGGLLLACVLIYPLPYYFTIVSERYRFPTEPFLLLFLVFAAAEAVTAVHRRGHRAVAQTA